MSFKTIESFGLEFCIYKNQKLIYLERKNQLDWKRPEERSWVKKIYWNRERISNRFPFLLERNEIRFFLGRSR